MKHLLITDDDHFITKILKQQFESAGYQVSSVNSGADAIEFLKETTPDAILLDLVLPDMSGVDILKYIRSHHKTKITPVIVFSNSYCFSGLVQAALGAGATKFLHKEECDIKALISQFDSLLNSLDSIQSTDTPSSTIATHTILVADDDVVIHGVLEFFLKQAGFAVRSAFDGNQALQIIALCPPDLIILDGLMPELNGFHVLEKIKQNPDLSKIPVIMMTSMEDNSLMKKMSELGAVEYLVKPFNLNHLVKLVKKHLTKQLAN